MSAYELRISLGKRSSVSQDPAPLQVIILLEEKTTKKQPEAEDSTIPASWRTSFSF